MANWEKKKVKFLEYQKQVISNNKREKQFKIPGGAQGFSWGALGEDPNRNGP